MSFTFQRQNFLIFLLLFCVECLIALFVQDQFIRPFIGDVLVIWLMVYFFRSFLVIGKSHWFISGVFLFACLIEIAQFFHILELLHLQENRLLYVLIGATFDWLDILAYAVGAGLLLYFPFINKGNNKVD